MWRRRSPVAYAVPLIAGVALVIALFPLPPRAQASGIATRTLMGQTPAVVTLHNAVVRGAHDTNAMLALNIGLGMHNTAQLDALIAAASTPGSPTYGHYLTRDQFSAYFAPTDQEVQNVRRWAQAAGLTVSGVSPDHLFVTVQGTTASVDRALNVTIDDYSAQGRMFMSNDRDPLVPASLDIGAISGLSTYDRYHTMQLPSPGSHSSLGQYYPADFLSAYNATSLANASGQTIGLTLWGAPVPQSDLDAFATNTGTLTVTANQAGDNGLDWIAVNGNSTDTSGWGEEAMDVEYAHGVAPNSHLKYWLADTVPGTCDGNGNYCTPDETGLELALDAAANDPSVHVVSSSWGGGEYDPSDPNEVNMESVFQYADSVGTTFYFSTGDQGYVSGAPCWSDPTCTTAAPVFPADSPYVVAVGGTNLHVNGDSSYSAESAWGGSYGASGGGCSGILARPSWQTGITAANGCTGRAEPDVAANADPVSGAYVCVSASCGGGNGGTSLAAPLWAGMAADMNAYLNAAGRQGTGWAAPAIYQFANNASAYARDFHDVTTGNNDPNSGGTNGYNAGPGWDEATGWGSPNLGNLAADWLAIAPMLPTASPTSTAGPPTFTATATPAAINTPVPPTSTPTNTPVPPTNTPIPPTNTPMPPPNTPTNTPIPPASTPTSTLTPTDTVTASPVPPTATRTVSAAAAATATPAPSEATMTPAPTAVRAKAHSRSASPLAIGGVTHGRVTGNGTVTITFHAAAHSAVTVTLRLTRTTVVLVVHGKHRKHVTHTLMLLTVTLHLKTDRHGQLRDGIHISYAPRKAVAATLSVTLRTRRSTVTHTIHVTVTPPPPRHKARHTVPVHHH